MNRKIGPLMDIVRMEDKEAKLKAFIAAVVQQSMTSSEATCDSGAILLIARSVESPVARAVAALLREGTLSGPVKAVLALAPRRQDEAASADCLASLVGRDGGRLLGDARLFDAHEQLVLGASTSWIGDCMRRDPMKRDAYECFAADCSKTARWARISFERLWDLCGAIPDDAQQGLAAVMSEEVVPPPVAEDMPLDPARSTR